MSYTLAWPVRFIRGREVVVEQETLDDIIQCVEVILRFRVGDRLDLPDFGIRDQAFQRSVDVAAIREALQDWEPRAELLTDQQIREAVSRVRLTVGIPSA